MKKFIFTLLLSCVSSAFIYANVTVTIKVNGTQEDSVNLCGMGDQIRLIATSSGGTAPYTYQWIDPSGQTAPTTGSSVFFTSTTYGSFYVICISTDNLGTKGKDSILVNVHPLPNLNYPFDTTICGVGNCANLTCSSTNANALEWNIGSQFGPTAGFTFCPPNSLTINVCPHSTTSYYATAYDTVDGCSKTNFVKVNVSDFSVTANASPSSICINDSAHLSVSIGGVPSGPYQYSWSPATTINSTTSSHPIAWPATTTTYCVTVTNKYGCTESSCITINNPILCAVKDDTTICYGGCAKLTCVAGGTSPFSYVWSPGGATTMTITPCPAVTTVYTATVTDGSGCANSASVTVTVNPQIIVKVGDDTTICFGGCVNIGGNPATASGGTAPYSYNWSPAAGLNSSIVANPLACPTVGTKYYLTVTDAVGCTAVDSVSIAVNPNLIAYAGNDTTICDGGCRTIGGSPTASGGTSPYTYAWSPATGLSSTTVPNPLACITGSVTYTVTVTDKLGCTATSSVVLNVSLLPSKYNVTGGGAICAGDSALIGLSNSDIGITYNLILNGTPPPVGTVNGTGAAISFGYYSTPGTYIVIAINNTTGCTDTMNGSAIIIVNPLPAPTITGNDTVCVKTPGHTYCTEAGMGGYIWTVSGGTITAGTGTNCITVTWNTVGKDTVKVNYTNGNGCTATTPTIDTITVEPLPLPIITGPNTACEASTGNTYCTQAGMSGYTWAVSAGGTITSVTTTDCITVTWNTSGAQTVSVNYTDANGCTDTIATVYAVTVAPLPVAPVSASVDTTNFCTGTVPTITLTATGGSGTTLNWSTSCGGPVIGNSTPLTIPSPATTTTYYASWATGCGVSTCASVTVTVFSLTPPIITGKDTVCVKTSGHTYCTQAGMTSYNWIVSGGTITAGTGTDCITVTWNTVGTDTVKVNFTNTNGCTDTTVTIYTVIVNPLPVPTLTGPNTICQGSTGNVYCTDAGMTGYTWAVSAGGTITSVTTTDCITVTWNTAGAQTVSVNYTNANGCTDTIATVYNVTVKPLPVAPVSASVDTTNFCSGTVPTITLTATGGSGTTLNWSTSCGGLVISNLNPLTISAPTSTTTYYAWWADACGVSTCVSVTVTVFPLPTPIIAGPASVCYGSTGNIYTTQAGQTGYTWTVSSGGTITAGTGTDAITVTWNAVGAQTVSVNDTNSFGCTAATATVFNVMVHSLTVPTITGPNTVCQGTTGNTYCTDAGMSGYTWAVSAGGTITSVTTTDCITVTWNTAGAQTVSVNYTDANGCTDTIATVYNVTVKPLPVVPVSASVDNTNFCSGTVATITLTATGGSGTTLNWSTSCGGPVIGSGTPLTITSPATTTTYYAWWTSACGVSTCVSVTVTVFPLPVPIITGPASVCYGSTGNIYTTQAGQTGYTWTVSSGGTITAGTGTDAITVTWNAVGAQTVSVNDTNSFGCTAATATVFNVMVHSLTVPTITGPNPACQGTTGNIYCTDAGMVGYTWAVSAGGTITSVTTTDCITVTWNTPGAQTVSVNYTDAFGCTDTIATVYSVTVDPLPVAPVSASVDTSDFCEGTIPTITLTATGGSGTTLNWSTSCGGPVIGSNTPLTIPSPTTTTTYYASWVNNCGVSTCASVTVKINQLPVPTITGPNPVCVKLTGNTYIAESGMTNYIWYVSSGGTITSGGNATADSVVVTWNTPGTDTVSVNYTDANGCTDTTATIYIVTVNPLPLPVITGPNPACQGTTGNIYSTQPGMTGYTWIVTGGTITTGSTTDNITVTWNTVGIESVSVNYTDANGCTDTIATVFTVTVDPLPVAPISASVDTTNFCAGTVANITLTATGGSGTTLNWSTSCGGPVTGSGTPLTIGSPATTTTYYASWVNGCGVSTCASVTVTVFPLPVPTITGPASVCVKSTGNIYTTEAGMSNYIWAISGGGTITGGGSATDNTVTVTWNTVGTQTVSVNYTNANGCTATIAAVYTVTVKPLPTPTIITGDSSVCEGSTMNVYTTQTGMTGYEWTISGGGTITGGGTSTDNTITVTWNTVGAQTVSINYDTNGCAATNATIYDVTVYPLPFDSLSSVNTSSCAACDGSISIIDKSDGSIPITYLWSNGSITSSILDLCPNTYTVTVTTTKGCEKTSTTTILAGTDVEQLTIVNTFSPNGDGINDTWVIKNIELYPNNELTVVNRWGNEVYHVTEYNNNWDGSGLSDGTYFYYLKVTMCGQENTFKGYVTIVR